ncbi:MAG: TIGR03986 family CRISPR-associated RAMP protein [Paraglaciecola sp.]|nr:TIGR03986 family CRISPR-associated RAMP protein [Paraglaciecola sp.]
MMDLMTPYRFIPLSPFILRPDWANLVSHDHPFVDGLSGVLNVALTSQTALCVGGKQEPASQNMPSKVHFYRTPDNRLAIPGSSIKGMLRNVLEIATFGHFRQVEDQQLGVRDISTGSNFYSTAINRSEVFTGWLKFNNGQWQIVPCDYARVYQGDLIDAGVVKKNDWLGVKLAFKRYELLGGLRKLKFDIEPYKYDCKKLAVNLGKGHVEGTLVVTGQPGPAFNENKSSKKREFVFYNTQKNEALVVDNQVISGFMRIHETSDEWAYWRKKLSSLEHGVPVFFHKNTQNGVKSLGLARMYRLPYEHSLHQAIGHTRSEHLESAHPDLAGLLFGWLDEQNPTVSNNLRGRVMPGLFTLTSEPTLSWEAPTVLSSPKPTFYPAYMKQGKANQTYKTLMDRDCELAGWKRYPLQAEAVLPRLTELVAKNKNVQIQMESLARGASFTGKIRFHNLRLIELGALLWALDFGQRDLSHSLGLGKPYGFGQVKLNCSLEHLQPNAENLQNLEQDMLLYTARAAFVSYMDQVWQSVTKTTTPWEQSTQVASLLVVQQVEKFKHVNLAYYDTPKQFMTEKQAKNRLAPLLSSEEVIVDTKVNLTLNLTEASVEMNIEQGAKIQAEATERLEKQRVKNQLKAELASMSEEEKVVQLVRIALGTATDEFNKTNEQKLAKMVNELHADADYWHLELKQEVVELGEQVLALAELHGKEKDKLGKAAKKLTRLIVEQ